MRTEYLDWDSNFFNLRIGKLEIGKEDIKELGKLKLYIMNSFDLVYIYSKSKIAGITLVDNKRIYICRDPKKVIEDKRVNDFSGHPRDLYELAYQAGHKSRFKIDPNISEEDFNRLYNLWVDNSVNKSFADYIKVFVENGIILGFITAKQFTDKISIGLIAVDKKSRSKGIGKKLISSIISIAAANKLPIEVATQADNIVACQFYESMGFTLKDESYIYHLWTRKN